MWVGTIVRYSWPQMPNFVSSNYYSDYVFSPPGWSPRLIRDLDPIAKDLWIGEISERSPALQEIWILAETIGTIHYVNRD